MNHGVRHSLGAFTLSTALLVAAVTLPDEAARGARAESLRDVVVTLRTQADLQHLDHSGGQRARRARVLERLRSTAAATQPPLIRALDGLADAGEVEHVRPFWIANVVALSASQRAIDLIRARPEVLSVKLESTFDAPTAPVAAGSIEPNLQQIGVPALWAQDLTGAGVVVAVLDTGVDVDHPDLSGSWRGGANSWFDPYGQHPDMPMDANGHGTWTTGVIVGGSAGGSAIGVAPGSDWIAARVFDDNGRGTTSGIRAALQWALDPDANPATDDAADVINNSWAYGSIGCHLDFEQDLLSLRSMDVLPVFAAGNGGPAASSDYSPANYPEALAVGAVDGTDQVLSGSSRGPSSCGGRSRVFPDIVAPGSNIRTADLYGFWTTASGTSMASPHVAGALALLLSGHPGLTALSQESILRQTARDLGVEGPDDTYGAGRLDAEAAWALTNAADTVGPLTTRVAVDPDPMSPTTTPTVSALADDTATGGSAVVAAEAFVDGTGPAGFGIAMELSAPDTSGTAVAAVLSSYPEGSHTVLVHAQDALGNWGAFASDDFTVDGSGPALSALTATPNPTAGSTAITMSYTATDSSGVSAGTVFESGRRVPVIDTAPVASDGSFGDATERVTATLDTAGWSLGEHRLQVRARDSVGNWSAASSTSLIVAPADGLFSDGLETGGLTRWSSVSGSTRLAVSDVDAPVGLQALRATVSGSGQAYVEDRSPAAESNYRARFWFDGGQTRTSSSGFDVLQGMSAKQKIVLELGYRRTSAGQMQVRAGTRGSSGGTRWSAWSALSSGPHAVEIEWRAGSSGLVRLYVDSVLMAATPAATGPVTLESIRLGPTAGLDRSCSGTLVFDAFTSSRTTSLGP